MSQALDSVLLAPDSKIKSFKQKAAVSSLHFKVSVDRCVQQHLLWEATQGFELALCPFPKGHSLSHGGLMAGGARRVGGDHCLSASLHEGIPSPFRISQPQGAGSGAGFTKPRKRKSELTSLRTSPLQAQPKLGDLGL